LSQSHYSPAPPSHFMLIPESLHTDSGHPSTIRCMPATSQSDTLRLHELDSLRGIAALTVMFGHVLMSYPAFCDASGSGSLSWWREMLLYSPLRVFWAGHEAVIFFFILSGFVLALPFFSPRGMPPYPLYLVKRVLRIYPPYLASVLAAFWLRNQFHHGPVEGLSTWFNESWRSAPSPAVIRDHVLMIGPFANQPPFPRPPVRPNGCFRGLPPKANS
jgi:hypothetical protein